MSNAANSRDYSTYLDPCKKNVSYRILCRFDEENLRPYLKELNDCYYYSILLSYHQPKEALAYHRKMDPINEMENWKQTIMQKKKMSKLQQKMSKQNA